MGTDYCEGDMMRKGYQEKEASCAEVFKELEPCWHIWTPADFEIIFKDEESFQAGMNIVGICSGSIPDITILTFELMSNHLHLCVSGRKERIFELIEKIKGILRREFKNQERNIDWDHFNIGIRKLESLKELRNVIIYINRNGYVVHPEHTPFSYPWGANRYFFNPDVRTLANIKAKNITLRQRRLISHSRTMDNVENLKIFEEYVLPLSFCDIDKAEKIFRDSADYFYRLGKGIEYAKEFMEEMKNDVFYTDDELYSIISKICRKNFGTGIVSEIPSYAKLELAKQMHNEYNASSKQICRFLKISQGILESIGIR